MLKKIMRIPTLLWFTAIVSVVIIFLFYKLIENKNNTYFEYILNNSESIDTLYKTSFWQIKDILFEDSLLFISDRLAFKVRSINIYNNELKDFGKFGGNFDEFKKGPHKIAYNKKNKNIAVLDFTLPTIKFLNKDLEYLDFFNCQLPPNDIIYSESGNLILGFNTPLPNQSILVINSKLQKIKSFSPKNIESQVMMDIFSLVYDEKTKNIFVVFQYKNIIEVYNENGDFIKEFSLPFLPDKSKTRKTSIKGAPIFPINSIFVNAISDKNGHIFILGGNYSKNKYRDIYVFSGEGSFLGTIIMDHKANIMTFDSRNNSLYVVSDQNSSIYRYDLKNMEI